FELSDLLARSLAIAGVVITSPNAATIRICRMGHLTSVHAPLASPLPVLVATKPVARKRGEVPPAPTLATMTADMRHPARGSRRGRLLRCLVLERPQRATRPFQDDGVGHALHEVERDVEPRGTKGAVGSAELVGDSLVELGPKRLDP